MSVSQTTGSSSFMVDVLLPEAYSAFFGIPRRLRVKGFKTKDQALDYEKAVKAAVYDRVQLPAKEDTNHIPKLWTALDRHFEQTFKGGKSERTRQSHLRRAKVFFSNKPIDEVTPMYLDQAVEAMKSYGYKGASINGILTFITGALKPYERYGMITPIKAPLQKTHKKKLQPLTPKEEEDLLGCLVKRSPLVADLVSLYLDTGCRKMELLNLKVRDVDVERARILVDGKTGPRTIPLRSSRAKEALRSYVAGKREDQYIFTDIHPTTIKYHLDIALKVVGIRRTFTVHDLRHTYCTRLSEEGISPFVIQKLVGHSSISTTERYTHLSLNGILGALGLSTAA